MVVCRKKKTGLAEKMAAYELVESPVRSVSLTPPSMSRVPSVQDVMDWGCYRRQSFGNRVSVSGTTSPSRRADPSYKKAAHVTSTETGDDELRAVGDQEASILVLYCGGTIGMRTKNGGEEIGFGLSVRTLALAIVFFQDCILLSSALVF